MKISAALTAVLALLLTAFIAFPVNAENGAGVEISAGDDIRAGKPFDIYVDLRDNEGLGAYKLSLSYDPDKLQFRYCSFSDKTKNKYMRLKENKGAADILCLFGDRDIKKETLKFRFSPLDDKGGAYGFSLYSVCSRPGLPEESRKLDMKLTVSENGSEHTVTRSEVSTAEKSDTSKVSGSSREVSEKTSKAERKSSSKKSGKTSSDTETAEVSPDADSSEESESALTEYSVKKKDTGSDTHYLETAVVFAGLAGLAAFAGVKTVKKLRKKRNINKE